MQWIWLGNILAFNFILNIGAYFRCLLNLGFVNCCGILHSVMRYSDLFFPPQMFPQLCVALWLPFGSLWVLTVKPWLWALDIPSTLAGLDRLFASSVDASLFVVQEMLKHLERTASTMLLDRALPPTRRVPMYKSSWNFPSLGETFFFFGTSGRVYIQFLVLHLLLPSIF